MKTFQVSPRSKRSSAQHRSRRGSAAVEAVMISPILTMMGICLMWLAFAGQKRVEVASVARGEFWAAKENAGDLDILSWYEFSSSPREVQQTVASREFHPKLLGPKKHTLKTRAFAPAGSPWDSRTVPFPTRGDFELHYSVWGEMNATTMPSAFIAEGPPRLVAGALQLVSLDLDGLANSAQDAIGQLGKDEAAAEKKWDEFLEEIITGIFGI